MTVKDAKDILAKNLPGLTPVSCVEYASAFVFDVRPKGKANLKNMIDSLVAVHKKNGYISDFKPFYISKEEYDNGRRIAL